MPNSIPPPLMHLAADNSARLDAAIADRELVRRVAARERVAFDQLYLAYHRRLSRFLMRFADNYEAVEEIINDTMFVVWQKADDFRGDSQVSTWIFGIAFRRAMKSSRHLQVQRRVEASACEDLPDDAEIFQAQDHDGARADWLAQGLALLPLEQRMILGLAYFLGHSCEEIAKIADCPVNTVKTRMFHARKRLREVLPKLAEPLAVPALTKPKVPS